MVLVLVPVSLSETSWVCGLRLCGTREQDSLPFARLGHTKPQKCRAKRALEMNCFNHSIDQ